jgi:DNA polymerase-4
MTAVPSNYPLYHKLSHKIHAFISAQIPQVEQYSIDEFFGDVSGWKNDEEVYAFAKELQAKILVIISFLYTYNTQGIIKSMNS